MKLVLSKPEKKWRSPNLEKKSPKFAQIWGFGQLFKFESLNFSDFAYFNRLTWCLNDNGGPVAEENFLNKFGPNLDLSPNLLIDNNDI